MYIACKNLTIAYKNRTVISDLNVSFPDNSINLLIGPSGGGKSTLIRSIASLNDPQSGTIFYGDKAHNQLHPRATRLLVGTIFQNPVLFEGNIYDNLIYGLKQQKQTIDDQKILEILSQLDIPADYLERKGDELSVGEQQRICIIRALLTNPDVFIMDEPTSALDPQRANKVLKLIKSLKTNFHKNVIMVTHDLHETLKIADYVYYLSAGKMQFVGTSAEFEEIKMNFSDNNRSPEDDYEH